MANQNFKLKVIRIISIIFYSTTAFAQNDFVKEYESFSQKFSDSLIDMLKSRQDDFPDKEITLKTIPYYYFLNKNDNSLSDSDAILSLKLNDYKGYVVVKRKSALYAIVTKDWFPKWQYFSRKEISRNDTAILKILSVVEKISKTYFFVYFFKPDSYYYNSIGFLEKGKLKFIDTSLQTYSFQEYISKRYGSVEKYLELSTHVKKFENLYSSIIESQNIEKKQQNCFNFLRNHSQEWVRNGSKDTLRILSLFISEMDSIVNLLPSQKEMLHHLVLEELTSGNDTDICRSYQEVRLFTLDITRIVNRVLTNKQFTLYNSQLRFINEIHSKIHNFLWEMYYVDVNRERRINNLPDISVDEAANKIRSFFLNLE